MPSALQTNKTYSAAPTGRISAKFDTGDLYKTCRDKPNLVKIGRKYRALYTEARVRCIVAGDIKSP